MDDGTREVKRPRHSVASGAGGSSSSASAAAAAAAEPGVLEDPGSVQKSKKSTADSGYMDLFSDTGGNFPLGADEHGNPPPSLDFSTTAGSAMAPLLEEADEPTIPDLQDDAPVAEPRSVESVLAEYEQYEHGSVGNPVARDQQFWVRRGSEYFMTDTITYRSLAEVAAAQNGEMLFDEWFDDAALRDHAEPVMQALSAAKYGIMNSFLCPRERQVEALHRLLNEVDRGTEEAVQYLVGAGAWVEAPTMTPAIVKALELRQLLPALFGILLAASDLDAVINAPESPCHGQSIRSFLGDETVGAYLRLFEPPELDQAAAVL